MTNTNEILKPIDFSPLIGALEGIATLMESELSKARLDCKPNMPHFLISSEHPCPHYVSVDKIHLLSDAELAVWAQLRRFKQKGLAQLNQHDVREMELFEQELSRRRKPIQPA